VDSWVTVPEAPVRLVQSDHDMSDGDRPIRKAENISAESILVRASKSFGSLGKAWRWTARASVGSDDSRRANAHKWLRGQASVGAGNADMSADRGWSARSGCTPRCEASDAGSLSLSLLAASG